MRLSDLWVSQNDVRHPAPVLRDMIDFVRRGGFFTTGAMTRWVRTHAGRPNPPLIAISRFPDDRLMVHDGHNRTVAISLGGRDFLRADEYFVTDFSYENYVVMEPQNGWYTPFDPRTEVRLAEFGDFKTEARRIFTTDPASLPGWVSAHRHDYCLPRDITTVAELVNVIKSRVEEHDHSLVAAGVEDAADSC